VEDLLDNVNDEELFLEQRLLEDDFLIEELFEDELIESMFVSIFERKFSNSINDVSFFA
jgi:hypothetical protein